MELRRFGWIFIPSAKDKLTTQVDHEPVVFCRECKYWQDNNGGYPNPECRWGHDETPDPDDYCSYGEKKEAGN